MNARNNNTLISHNSHIYLTPRQTADASYNDAQYLSQNNPFNTLPNQLSDATCASHVRKGKNQRQNSTAMSELSLQGVDKGYQGGMSKGLKCLTSGIWVYCWLGIGLVDSRASDESSTDNFCQCSFRTTGSNLINFPRGGFCFMGEIRSRGSPC